MHDVRIRAVAMIGAILVELAAMPAWSAVISLDSQERAVEAHVTIVSGIGLPVPRFFFDDRVQRASDFGPFSGRANLGYHDESRNPISIAYALAAQNSVVLGSSLHADGSAFAGSGSSPAFGVQGGGRAKSVFLVRFTIHELCTVHLAGNAFVKADPAEIFFTGPNGIVWHSGWGSVHGPFDLPGQLLQPGQYTLHAEAIGSAAGSAFQLDMVVDTPLVGVQPLSWSSMKRLYR